MNQIKDLYKDVSELAKKHKVDIDGLTANVNKLPDGPIKEYIMKFEDKIKKGKASEINSIEFINGLNKLTRK